MLRRRLGLNRETPRRLVVEKASWLRDACSPVMLSIDDLANAWHNRSGGSRWEHGGDWGAGRWEADSVLRFIEDRLLRDYPEVKITFFTVAGPISSYTRHQPFSYSAPLDATDASSRFFRSLAEDGRFELAYHGFDHGTAGARTEDFRQEWLGFASVEAAVEQTRRGLDIFSRATGIVPRGGKWGGWEYNEFAEPALDHLGFLWWCRDWAPRDTDGRVSDGYYEPQLFGSNRVIALPTTVHGRLWDRRQIDTLLARRQLIAIEEHIAPIRPDGLTQTPNIVDDLDDVKALLSYLRRKNVWYATGSEIADYLAAREHTHVHDVALDRFCLQYEGRAASPMLTLRIDSGALCGATESSIDLMLPDGTFVDRAAFHGATERHRHVVTVPVSTGQYIVRPRSRSD
jgi:hypothetical protein